MDDSQDVGQDSVDIEVTEVETEARSQGWVPQEEFKGNPDHWRDAPEFVEFGRKLNPILRKTNDELKREILAVKQQFEGYKGTVEQLVKAQQTTLKREYEDQIQVLKLQIREARNNGDLDTADQYQEHLDTLKENKPDFEAPPVRQDPERAFNATEYQEFLAEGFQYVETDPKMGSLAQAYAVRRWAKDKSLTGKEFLRSIMAEVKADNPEKFEVRKPRPMVEGASAGASAPQGQASYARLNSTEKAACDDFVKSKLGTKEDYVKLLNSFK
jgi:hypothetical protein